MFRIVSLMLIVAVLMNAAMAQSEEIFGVVTPIPDRHFQGSPTKDWPVTKIHVKVGDKVKVGDCLVELDPAVFPLQKAQAELDSAKSHLDVIKSQLVIRELILKRHQDLSQVGASSQQEREERTEAVNVLKCELAKAEACEKAAYASFRMAKYDFDTYQRINTPISGEVVAIRCSLGLVARSESQQIVWIEVIDSSRVHIHCQIPPQSVSTLRKLMTEKKTLKIKSVNCTAKVVAVPRMILNGKFDVILEADNPDLELVCGQEIQVILP